MASAMTEVAVRLAEPDKLAEQSVASVGQTIRRQVAAMNDAISRGPSKTASEPLPTPTGAENPAPDGALPRIIQGGMGAGVSDWRLARAVSVTGQLGVVSGTALDVICARRLQDGDRDGNIRRALDIRGIEVIF